MLQAKWTWLNDYAQTVPYTVFPETLYTRDSLLDGFRPYNPEAKAASYDRRVYAHFIKTGKRSSKPQELMLRSLHDQSIGGALDRFLARFDTKKIVGIMGGHALARNDLMYRKIVLLAKQLTERFNFKGVAITLRESKSANDNDWSGMLYTNGEAVFSKKYYLKTIIETTISAALYGIRFSMKRQNFRII